MKIKTKDMFVIFVIAKLLSICVAFFIFGLEGSVDLISLLAHLLSMVIFIGLLLLVTKQSVTTMFYDTRLKGPKWGSSVIWIVLCIPLGFLVRSGSEGVYLILANVVNHQSTVSEFSDLVARFGAKGGPVLWLLVLGALAGACDEEFVYRRVFLWHLSKKYGIAIGVLVTSLMFGAIHLNPIAVLAAFCLACTYLASGRLWVVVIVHAAGNVFHPLMDQFIVKTNWVVYFNASIASAVILCIVITSFVFEIKYKKIRNKGDVAGNKGDVAN